MYKKTCKTAVFSIICSLGLTFAGTASAQSKEEKYKECLVDSVSKAYASGAIVFDSYLDVETLVKLVAPSCSIQLNFAAMEYISDMFGAEKINDVNMKTISVGIKDFAILDVSVAIHQSLQ